MKDIPCAPGARRIRAMVAQGEHQNQDFKYAVSDARKIARSVSAFANRDGGRLLIGVKDNGVIAGVRTDEDASLVETAAEIYCRPSVPVSFHAYSVDTDVRVVVAEIAPANRRPVYAPAPDGTWRAYYRVADENIAACPLMVGAWERRAGGTPLMLGSRHGALLDILSQCGEMEADSRRIALALHAPESIAAETAIELAAAGAITFRHSREGFTIVRADAPV